MKKTIGVLLIMTFLLSACSIDWNDEKDVKIAELEKKLQDDTFKKKQECSKMRSDYTNYLKTIDNPLIQTRVIDTIYSPLRKTCIAGSLSGDNYFIQDMFSKNEYKSPSGIYSWNEIEYNNKIKELKGD